MGTHVSLFVHITLVKSATVPGFFTCPPLAIAVGKAIMIVCITYAGAASGGHINPNLTLLTVMLGMTTITRFCMYAVAQTLGAITGALMGRIAVGWDQNDAAAMLGGCGVAPGMTQVAAMVATGNLW